MIIDLNILDVYILDPLITLMIVIVKINNYINILYMSVIMMLTGFLFLPTMLFYMYYLYKCYFLSFFCDFVILVFHQFQS